jgi:hypothetical protein
MSPYPFVRATEIGEYIRHNSCERRFKLEYDGRREADKLPFASRFFNSIDPVLQAAGRRYEDQWEQYLRRSGLQDATNYRGVPTTTPNEDKKTSWEVFAGVINALNLTAGQSSYGREIEVDGEIGAFPVRGRIDFVLLLWENNRPRLRIVESKASRRDRTYHRIQVAIYRMLVVQKLADNPVIINGVALTENDIECVVVRIDESTNQGQDILALPPLDLTTEQADIELLLEPGGPIEYIVNTSVPDLNYQLNEKCDGCVFNVYCFPESARENRLELLGLDPATVRALINAGVPDIDELVTLDLNGHSAAALRANHTFSDNLANLKQIARSRSTTLPGGSVDPDAYPVEALSNTGSGQLPSHEFYGHRLVRIYLSVDYDYVENRIGALSAHVTKSEGQINTKLAWNGTAYDFDTEVAERIEAGRDPATDKKIYNSQPVSGQDVIEFKSSPWTGRYEEDTGSERELIQSFLHKLIDTIADVAEDDFAPIHFYVWSKGEISHLVEACARVGSGLLGHLRELLGCREGLEQLIYSSVKDEVDHRYALGWTGRGLAVVSSLTWFGRRFHWVRRIAGRDVALDQVFEQDIFDFKTSLSLRTDNSWATDKDDPTTVAKHKFEIRSRFNDSLSAPYWRAYWGELDANAPGLNARVRSAIERYNQARKPKYLLEYFRARVHALRWIEESVAFKNEEIDKPSMDIRELQRFTLNVNDPARAAIDFLRLDQFISVTQWIAAHLIPPANRVPLGQTIPITNIRLTAPNKLIADIDLTNYDVDYASFEARCGFGASSFVRLTVCHEDPHRGQSFNMLTKAGSTCMINDLNWHTREVALSIIPSTDGSNYILKSNGFSDTYQPYSHATLDESPSDFVSGHVDKRLASGIGSHVYNWFDPITPDIPPIDSPTAAELSAFSNLIATFEMPPNNNLLAADQQSAAIAGLTTKIQLLQGPPGTGKTTTSSVATLLRILAGSRDGDIVLIAANTHPAINTLLLKIDQIITNFAAHSIASGLRLPAVKLSKVHSGGISPSSGAIEDFESARAVSTVKRLRRNGVLIIGGTTGAILKMAGKLNESADFKSNPNRFDVSTLIVDEASMMVFPYFLALVSLVQSEGEIMLTGDHRQLAPIVAHDWDREDRPPVLLFQPYVSAYEAVQKIKHNINTTVPDNTVLLSSLSYTFRLPAEIRELIARLYRLDDIELEGPTLTIPALPSTPGLTNWERLWEDPTGLFLVLHNERESKQSNETEAAIIQEILNAGGVQPDDSIAVVTPHRAHRTLLKTRLDAYLGNSIGVIDTVERLQGGERPTVIVSATASDPAAISSSAKFILDLNRSNVAFSRTQQRLIVVVSEALLNYIPAEYENYQSTMLWKSLRSICHSLVGTEDVNGHRVRILTIPSSTSI